MTNPIQLSSARPACLGRLRPMALQPERISERPEALRALERIEMVEVSSTRQSEGTSQKAFVVDVCFKLSRHRIPVVSSRAVCCFPTPTASSISNPDVQSLRTFSEIRRLRDAVYYAANSDHGLASCAYCNAITDFILLGSSTPFTGMQWLQKEETQYASLTKFIQQLVRLAVQVKTGARGDLCRGQQRIPELMSEFLQVLDNRNCSSP